MIDVLEGSCEQSGLLAITNHVEQQHSQKACECPNLKTNQERADNSFHSKPAKDASPPPKGTRSREQFMAYVWCDV